MRKLIIIMVLGLVVCLAGQVSALTMAKNIDAYFVATDIFLAPSAPDTTSLLDYNRVDSLTYSNSVVTMATKGGTPTIAQPNTARTIAVVIHIGGTALATANTRVGSVTVVGKDAKGNAKSEKKTVSMNAYSNTPSYRVVTSGAFSRIEKIIVDNALANSCAYTDTISVGVGYGIGLRNDFYQKVNDTASLIAVYENAIAVGGWTLSGVKMDYVNGVFTPLITTNATINYIVIYKAKLK
jgi:hypothetical protein